MADPTDLSLPPPAPVLPGGVLLQSIYQNAHGQDAGYRIYEDGRYETRVHGHSWTEERRLTEAQLAAIRLAIHSAHLERLQPYYAAAEAAEDHGLLWLQVAHGGAPRAIAVQLPRRVPEIDQLAGRLVEVFQKPELRAGDGGR